MAAAGRAPHVVAGGGDALCVHERAFQHEGLLELDVLVVGQYRARAKRVNAVSSPVALSSMRTLRSIPLKRLGTHGKAATST